MEYVYYIYTGGYLPRDKGKVGWSVIKEDESESASLTLSILSISGMFAWYIDLCASLPAPP